MIANVHIQGFYRRIRKYLIIKIKIKLEIYIVKYEGLWPYLAKEDCKAKIAWSLQKLFLNSQISS